MDIPKYFSYLTTKLLLLVLAIIFISVLALKWPRYLEADKRPPAANTSQKKALEVRTYQSRHRYTFVYPANWNLTDASTDLVVVSPNLENPYQNIVFEYVSAPPKLGQAIVCDTPIDIRKNLSSGQAVLWVIQNNCLLPEDRDRFGSGSSIESNIALPDGNFLHIMGNSTTKPDSVIPEEISSVLNSLTLQ